MDRFPRRASDWVGLGAIALGAVVLSGYAVHSQLIVQLRQGMDDAMVVNTAISFVFSGLALLGWRWLGTLPVIALNGAALIETLTGRSLGVDWPQLHAWLHESDIYPGRISPITCIGFLLFAIAILVVPRTHTRRGAYVVRTLTGLVVLTAATGIIGFILRFDMLFDVHGMTRTALHSGIGLLALGVGLWLSWRNERWNGMRRITAHGRRILTTAAAALVIVVAAAGVSGFWLLERLAERDAAVQLAMRRQERVLSIRALLESALRRGELLAERLDGKGGALSPAAAREFSTVELRGPDGRVQNRIGQPLIRPQLSLALPAGTHASLLWNRGYYLRQILPTPAPRIGAAILEQPLPLVASVGIASPTWGKSGEIAICGRSSPQRMACFPIRLHPEPFYLDFSMYGAPLPMSRALNGDTGVTEALDYRGQRVLAAYAPIPGTGLGLVAKMDTAELYAPIRRQFLIMVPLLAILTLTGLELLRWQMRPLVRELVESRNQAVVSEARFRAAAESGLDPFFIFTSERDPATTRILDFHLVYANHAGERLAALETTRSVRIGLEQLHALAVPGGLLDKFSRVVSSRQPLEFEFPTPLQSAVLAPQEEGAMRWLHLQAAPLGDGVAVTMRDISQRKWEEERLLAMAQTDPLTGLANRSAFRKRLMHAMESSRRLRRQGLLALLYLDIDHFKEINDTLGHDQGDRLLEVFAERLRSCVRTVDTVARPGGDEFTILLENLDSPDDAERVVLAIYTSLRRKVRLNSQDFEIGTSIGLAFYRGEEISADELMRRADAAMYAAKREGRNRFRVFAA